MIRRAFLIRQHIATAAAIGLVTLTSAPAWAAGSSASGSPPDWAKRMRRSQTISHGASAATHAVRSGDGSGGGASVDLSEGE